jgi:hypothetical protein
MQAVSELNGFAAKAIETSEELFGRKIGVFGKIFGCRHKRLTRPITSESTSYRACVNCGARKHFDTRTFRSSGRFYYPPTAGFGNY